MEGHPLQLLFNALAIRGVAQVQQSPADRRLRIHVGAVDLDHALPFIAARHACLEVCRSSRFGEVAAQEFAEPGPVVEGHELLEMLADQVLGRKPEDPLRSGRHVSDRSFGSHDRDHVRRVADQGVEAGFGRARREPGLQRHSQRRCDRLARKEQARRDADDPGNEPGRIAEASLMQFEERIAGEHERCIRHERSKWRAALGRVHWRRASLGSHVVEMGRNRERRDRGDMKRARKDGNAAGRSRMGLEQARAQQGYRVQWRMRRAQASPASRSGAEAGSRRGRQ